jgi:putative endonuclease
MIDAKELGKIGEKIAAEELATIGYRIITKNFYFGKNEVDIICEDDDKIVFVEVKTRVSNYLSDASLLVPVKKQKQIIKVADHFLKEYYPEKEARFDIMIVVTNSQYTKIEHIVDAFYPMC